MPSKSGRSNPVRQKSAETVYDYRDEQGELVHQVVRVEPGRNGASKNIFQRRPKPGGGWFNDLNGVRPIPYRLPELLGQPLERFVFVAEGEKCVDTLWNIDVAATTNAGGAGNWKAEHSAHLQGRTVVILPDNDEPGRRHAEAVLTSLKGVAASAAILDLPGLPLKGDIVEWLAAGHTKDELMQLAAERLRKAQPKPARDQEDDEDDEDERKQKSAATKLVKLAEDSGVHLFHTADLTTYAVLPVGQHKEVWRIKGQAFAAWLQKAYYGRYRKVASAGPVLDAVSVLNGIALHDRPENSVHVRVGDGDGTYYLHLADSDWRTIRLTPDGWRIMPEVSVRFRRASGMLPLPEPLRGGQLELLRQHLNYENEGQWMLLVSWLLAAFRPHGPYPVLLLSGQQGSAKSTVARILRALIDPNTADIRSEPRTSQDLAIAADNSWVVALDNLSGIHSWLSDALCRLSTGGGFSTRKLFTDDDERIFSASRPVIITSIEDVASRGDLLERSLVLQLPPIPSEKRRTESELWEAFKRDRPGILGSLLDIVCAGMRRLASVQLKELPRMADFARWIVA
jgi:hypothetical protein